jgi:hypothetical protein
MTFITQKNITIAWYENLQKGKKFNNFKFRIGQDSLIDINKSACYLTYRVFINWSFLDIF